MTDGIDQATESRSMRNRPPMVVGLGASAGGIKALKEFFSHVRSDGETAYVAILHLSPEYDSRLAEVLQVTASIPVLQVVDRAPIEPDHVYVISPSTSLEIHDGELIAAEITRREQRRAPVDVFFRTLADAHGARSACVILSGTGPNGSAGLKRVKEYGGLVIAQNPSEAEHDDMPRNAIATGLVDYVLPVAEMPARIAEYRAHLKRDDRQSSATPATTDDREALREILTLVGVRTGHDFSNYKTPTLRRRIDRRMNLRGLTSIGAYARAMRDEPNEAVRLMRELLISVTNFFRDPQAFDALAQRVIPRLFMGKQAQDQVRVWVAGCATGEEAYSLGMLLTEHAAALSDRPSIQVFATDLDEHAIAVAREGLYSEADLADVSEERVQRFFTRDTAGYRVRRDLRELMLFAHHNVIKDPPFSHLDLISCRNLLIYLTRSIQERLIDTFHFALRPGAYLFLGTSESPDCTNDLFVRLDQTMNVYESRTVASRVVLPPIESAFALPRTSLRAVEVKPAERVIPADLHQRLLEEYAPPSLLVTEDLHIMHISERASRYLQMASGEPTRDLLRLVRPELRPDLRTALHEATRSRTAVVVRDVRVALEDGERHVNLAIRPVLRDGDPARGFLLVLFQEVEARMPPNSSVQFTSPAEPLARQLEEELSRVRAQLRATVEQYETQVEEARAANEELQALNEELRSAAEELETSKEELQSVNEELTTVNQELKIKIEELGLTNNDFQNFINSTDIGTIFLDRSLRVKLSTPKAKQVFNLLDSDVGRPLSDITSRLVHPDIHAEVSGVLARLQRIEREVQTHDGTWHLMRILPYRTMDNRIDGVVLTFQDISSRREAEQHVRVGEERLRALIDSAIDYAIFTMSEDGTIDSWNTGAQRLFGYRAEQIVGQNFEVLFTPEDRAANAPQQELQQTKRAGRAADERYHLRQNGTRFYCSGVTTRLGEGGMGLAKIARDLTGSQEAKLQLERARNELEERVTERTVELAQEARGHSDAAAKVIELMRRLVSAQEEERQRLSRDLHDEVGQLVTALRLALERHQAAPADKHLEAALSLTADLGREIDFIAWQLRPAVLDELGLAAALPRFVETWSAHAGVPADARVENYRPGTLPPTVEVTFYRILQEALHNVAKHARATRVDVVLSTANGTVALVVEDDGIGFDTTAISPQDGGGFGLTSMRERASLSGAILLVESTPGKGTSVFLQYP